MSRVTVLRLGIEGLGCRVRAEEFADLQVQETFGGVYYRGLNNYLH